jgi:hypothetical protein
MNFEPERSIGIGIGASEIARYVDGFIRQPDTAQAYFASLQAKLDWTQHPTASRGEYWWSRLGRPYGIRNGRGSRIHQPKPGHWAIAAIRQQLQHSLGFEYEGCFLSLHRNGRDFFGWSGFAGPGMNYERPIAFVTLGAGHEIEWRRIGTVKKTEYFLSANSLLLLHPHIQQTYEQRIPRSSESAPRITLAFRSLRQ